MINDTIQVIVVELFGRPCNVRPDIPVVEGVVDRCLYFIRPNPLTSKPEKLYKLNFIYYRKTTKKYRNLARLFPNKIKFFRPNKPFELDH